MFQNVTPEKKITPKQRRALEALLAGEDIATAAQTAGVARQTLHRWQQEEHFARALQEAESLALEGLSRALVGLGELATQAIRDGLQPEQPIAIRLRAADLLTNRLLAIRQAIDFEQRLQELEQQIGGMR